MNKAILDYFFGKPRNSGKTRGAFGRASSIPEGYDGKFQNPKKKTHSGETLSKK
jgi:hypothetical protein